MEQHSKIKNNSKSNSSSKKNNSNSSSSFWNCKNNSNNRNGKELATMETCRRDQHYCSGKCEGFGWARCVA
jgi:hypothetical protein